MSLQRLTRFSKLKEKKERFSSIEKKLQNLQKELETLQLQIKKEELFFEENPLSSNEREILEKLNSEVLE